jgi:flagellar basal-body rod modification protein FlgD
MQLDPLSLAHRATTAITSGTTPASSGSTATTSQQSTISIQDFMQLLSTEMANQDPLQPMDPTQTMTQLAQFTGLQQTTALAQSQSLATGNSYLGAQVTVSNGPGQAPLTGTVTAVDTSGVASGSPPQLVVSGGSQEYPLSSVTLVQFPAAAATPSSGTQ